MEKSKKNLKILSVVAIVALLLAIFVSVAAAVVVTLRLQTENSKVADDTPDEIESEEEQAIEEPPVVAVIDLQPLVDGWVSSLPRGVEAGLEIYDLENNLVAGSYNVDTTMATASLYKLFVVYEGYRRTSAGEWGADIYECLDLAIRESNSDCAESVRAKIGINNLEDIIQNVYNLPNTSTRILVSTPDDIVKMLKIYYDHTDLNEDAWARIKDSMLNQPMSGENCDGGPCDWRMGLPKGFSNQTNVYNKVGWDWDGEKWAIYNDAAILEFPEQNRHFAVVVMTSGLSSVRPIVNLGTMLENEILSKI